MLCLGAAMFAVLIGKMSALSQALSEEEAVRISAPVVGLGWVSLG